MHRQPENDLSLGQGVNGARACDVVPHAEDVRHGRPLGGEVTLPRLRPYSCPVVAGGDVRRAAGVVVDREDDRRRPKALDIPIEGSPEALGGGVRAWNLRIDEDDPATGLVVDAADIGPPFIRVGGRPAGMRRSPSPQARRKPTHVHSSEPITTTVTRSDLPTGTVTFLFTDIEGSTRLLHALGTQAYADALARHRALLRQAFRTCGGVEVDTQGDAFFVAFDTAAGAAEAAAAAHTALSEGPVRVRIGLHTGSPQATADGYVGEDVHRGARIAALAHGGQSLVSSTTAALLDDVPVRDLGLHRLKDFEGATRVYQLSAGNHPPLRTPGSVDLPTPATPFVGRQHELLDAVSVVLGQDPRVLTIVGPGGTGKTRFAIELARLLADEARGGTVFVPLASLREANLVLAPVAERLGAGSPDPTGIAARIGEGRTHVVLDNLEQLLPEAAPLLSSLIAAAPSLRLIVTSREALRIQGEAELDLPPLVEDDAVELFLARARAVRAGVTRTHAVDQLCERLDRLPLALELAAARTKLLSPDALLERLASRLDLLKGTRDADHRHGTLRATIAWSYDLLEPAECDLFARLSVFRGGCTLEGAEDVCSADVDTIASLLDKSLLRRRTEADGTDRYWMLETIREFASERLQASGTFDQAMSRLGSHLLELARSAHLSEETGLGAAPVRHDLVLAERDNFRAVLDWAARHDVELGLEIATSIELHWVAHDPAEGARRVERLLEGAMHAPAELRARALRLHGGTAFLAGDREAAARSYEESLALFARLGDDRNVASLLLRQASKEAYGGDTTRARDLVDQALDLGRRSGLSTVEPIVTGTLAVILEQEGDLQGAYEHCLLAAELAERIHFSWWQSINLANALELGLRLGQSADLESVGLEVLRLALTTEDRVGAIWGLTGIARIALEHGDVERAGRLWGAVGRAIELQSLGANTGFLETFSAPLEEIDEPRFLDAVVAGGAQSIWALAAELLDRAQTLP